MTCPQEMLKATELVRGGRLKEATQLIRVTLRGYEQTPTGGTRQNNSPAANDRVIEFTRFAETAVLRLPPSGYATSGLDARFKAKDIRSGLGSPLASARHHGRADTPIPYGASFVEHSCSCPQGTLKYKLYVPSAYSGQPLPLLVMLHGCTQSPDDFAAGTRMNTAAEEQNLLVAYPAQPHSANASKCWNWFRSADQQRGAGEPAMIAAATRQIMAQYSVRSDCVFVAGLSAGGAAAAVLGATYPDLYAAIGVHSGLACGAAHDLPSAIGAMRTGGRPSPIPSVRHSARPIRTIVFHGDSDKTVNPVNSDLVLAQFEAKAKTLTTTSVEGRVPGGLRFVQTVHRDGDSPPHLEKWIVHGAGHAWSGGNPSGSFTEPRGPDASREMLRFFLDDGRGPGRLIGPR
jgi:poly(hydroxyalkanoate) depolymerase family esterase